jgi:ADP-ribose pyrophosphatase
MDVEMDNIFPIQKEKISNNEFTTNWHYGSNDSNVILENKELCMQILRYKVINSRNILLYDAISIRESKNSSVILIRNQKKEIGLVWEWRPMPEKWFWACVRGFGALDGEDFIGTAKREIIEEIGNCRITHSQNLGLLYQNTTFFENPVGLILLDVEIIDEKLSSDEGITEFKFFSYDEIITMIREGKIEDTFTLSAFMKYSALIM